MFACRSVTYSSLYCFSLLCSYANCFMFQDIQGRVLPLPYVRKTVKPLIGKSDVTESRLIRYPHWNTSCTVIGKFTCTSGYIRNNISRQNTWNKICYVYVILLTKEPSKLKAVQWIKKLCLCYGLRSPIICLLNLVAISYPFNLNSLQRRARTLFLYNQYSLSYFCIFS